MSEPRRSAVQQRAEDPGGHAPPRDLGHRGSLTPELFANLRAWLRGDYFWRHERWFEYRLAQTICWGFGHTENIHDGGDCRRCWE